MSEAKIIADWRADPAIYWKNHMILAAVFAVAAYVVLWAIGNPFAWTGPVAAVLAVFARAAFLRSEYLNGVWQLSETQLKGPLGRLVPLSAIAEVKPLFGDVLVVTHSGDKHLMKYLTDPAAVIAQIQRTKP